MINDLSATLEGVVKSGSIKSGYCDIFTCT